MKILVIDDDHLVRYTLSKILRAHGHEVCLAADGARGTELMSAERPELVITDIIMPEQEGFETIVQIRRDCERVKIIAISGGFRSGNLDVLSMAHSLGADDVLAKPFEEDDLMRAVDRVVRSSPISSLMDAD